MGSALGGIGGFLMGGPMGAMMGLGMAQQSKAAKAAERAANEQSNAIAHQQNLARAEQSRINSRLDASRKKLALGMARTNRRRSKGGLFGDTAETQGPAPSSTLGG